MKNRKKRTIEDYIFWAIIIGGPLFMVAYVLSGVIHYVYFYKGV